MLSNPIFIDMGSSFSYIESCAGVVKLVDARDSKSRGPQAHVGSIPTSGTNYFNRLASFKERFSEGFSGRFDHFLTILSGLTKVFSSPSSTIL